MVAEETIRRYKMISEIEEKVRNDIFDIACLNEDFLNDVYYMHNEDIIEVCDCVFDIFFYEKIYTYSQDEAVKDGLMFAVNNFFRDIYYETNEYEKLDLLQEKVCKRIRQYMDDFKYPIFNDEYAGKDLFEEVMSLSDDNPYKEKLWYALLYPIYEELNEIDKYQMINDVLVYYDFEYKIKEEMENLAKERYRIKNHIPDFSNVKEGQTWSGAHRYSKFIKDLKLTKYKSQSNSHLAQMKSISRSCKWIDDEKSKIITLIEIYPERMPKENLSRIRKYEDNFKNVLLYHLQRCDGIFKCSSGKLWTNMYVIPMNYKKIAISNYIDKLNIKDKYIDELKKNLKVFHNNVDKRLKEILKYNLKYLEQKGIVRISKQMVIVKGSKHIPIDEVKEIGLSSIEAEEMIDNANEYGFKNISGNFYDEQTGQFVKRHPVSFAEVKRIYKDEEHREIVEKYVQENYGWNYVYEEYVIRLNDKWKNKTITDEEYKISQRELNNLIVEAIKNNNKKKYNNLKKKHDDEDKRINKMMEECEDINELIQLGVVDADGVVQNKQYMYPLRFIEQLDCFIETEIML